MTGSASLCLGDPPAPTDQQVCHGEGPVEDEDTARHHGEAEVAGSAREGGFVQ